VTRGAPERGFAIVATLGMGVAMSVMAVGLLLATSIEVQIAATFRNGLEARHAADAGAHRAATELAAMTDWNVALDGRVRSTFADGPPSGVRLVPEGPPVDLDLVRSLSDCGHRPPCSDAELDVITARRPWGVNNPRWQLFAYGRLAMLLPSGAMPSRYYLVVMIADDPSEVDGDPLHDAPVSTPGAGLLRIRSEAFGPGGAHSAVEVTVARPVLPAGALRLVTWRETT
jgi:hypothetical protein